MSQTPPSVSSSSNYQSIFDSALQVYKRKTGKDLTLDPLLRSLETCHSPDAVLDLLRAQILKPGQPQSSGNKFTTWLDPTVNVLNSFSATIGGFVGLVSPKSSQDLQSDVDFEGLSTCGSALYGHRSSSFSEYFHRSLFPSYYDILISQAAQGISADRDALIDLFERIENIFRRLETYVDVPPTPGMTDVIVKVMVEVLCILGIATKEIKQNRASKSIIGDR